MSRQTHLLTLCFLSQKTHFVMFTLCFFPSFFEQKSRQIDELKAAVEEYSSITEVSQSNPACFCATSLQTLWSRPSTFFWCLEKNGFKQK